MKVLLACIWIAWMACPPLLVLMEVVKFWRLRHSVGIKPHEFWVQIHGEHRRSNERQEKMQEELLRKVDELLKHQNRPDAA